MIKITIDDYLKMSMDTIFDIVNRGGDKKTQLNNVVSNYLDSLNLSNAARSFIANTDISILSDIFGGCFTNEDVNDAVKFWCEEGE